MASDFKVTVEGAKELRQAAKRAGKDVQKELGKAHKQVASIIAEGSKMEAPKRSGRLANAIRAGGTQKSALVRGGSKNVPYAGPIHFGWRKHGITPNPFIYRTMKAKWSSVMEAYEDQVQKVADLINTRR